MAFPIPSHLPRRPTSQDVSSKIISKIGEATSQTLNATLAASWLSELDETIQLTQNQIHERMNVDLPSFEQQLSASQSVQTRLQTLTSNVENLSRAHSDMISTLIQALMPYAALARKSIHANVAYDALVHLSRCRNELLALSALVEEGKLPDAVSACGSLDKSLLETPSHLSQAGVVVDLKRKFRMTKDRAEEQLSNSYSKSITISPTDIEIRPSVQVRQSITVLDLPAILSSLSPPNLIGHLTSFRRDLIAHYIVHTFSQPTSITLTTSSTSAHNVAYKLTQFSSPPDSSHVSTRLTNVSTVLTFLSTHFFSCLPPSQFFAFPQSLCKPISGAVLTYLLVPALPSSFAHLPAFLDLVKQAVEFEDAYVVGVLGMKTNERIIKDWADGVSGHYERKRRMEILGHARDVIVRDQKMKTFTVEVEHMHQIAPEQAKVNVKKEETLMEEVDQAWGFDDDEDKADDGEGEADGWGFDDDVEPEQENPSEDEQHEEDPSDAWGWNDNDPSAGQRPVDSSFVAERETYLVSLHTRQTLAIVADVLREGNEFASSSMFSSVPLLSLPSPGAVLLQSASAVVDLFRALSPIHLGKGHVGLAKAMQFSNDCLYLSGELAKLSSDEKLVECKEKLKILGDSWFDDTIEKQRRSVDGILVTVEGFTYTTEQDRYDECEDALGRVVRDIRAVARLWEAVLAKGKYYTAIGLVVDAALSRILEDILALPDITEVESHRLSELCRILNALEGLFVMDTNEPSFVVAYVPSWLKFSYLSELLEASMADISYLFEEGALVDFTIDELVRLVRALFADTPLRATTISKLLGGHNRSDDR